MDQNLATPALASFSGIVPRHLRRRAAEETPAEAAFVAVPPAPPEPKAPPVDLITADLRRRIATSRPPTGRTPLKMAGSACAGIGLALLMLYV